MVFCHRNALLGLVPAFSVLCAQSAFALDESEEQPVGIEAEVSGVKAPGKRGRGAAQKSSEVNGRGASELPEDVEPGSSAHERLRRPFSFRVGAGLMFGPGFTVGAGYNVSHQLSLEGAWDSAFTFIKNGSRTRFGALAHFFPGNSFFLNGGLVFERSRYEKGLLLNTAPLGEGSGGWKEDAFQASFSQLQAQFGLGNRWSFGGFFLGVEWVGYSKSFITLSETFTVADGYTKSEYDEPDAREFANLGSFRQLNTHLGFAF